MINASNIVIGDHATYVADNLVVDVQGALAHLLFFCDQRKFYGECEVEHVAQVRLVVSVDKLNEFASILSHMRDSRLLDMVEMSKSKAN